MELPWPLYLIKITAHSTFIRLKNPQAHKWNSLNVEIGNILRRFSSAFKSINSLTFQKWLFFNKIFIKKILNDLASSRDVIGNLSVVEPFGENSCFLLFSKLFYQKYLKGSYGSDFYCWVITYGFKNNVKAFGIIHTLIRITATGNNFCKALSFFVFAQLKI